MFFNISGQTNQTTLVDARQLMYSSPEKSIEIAQKILKDTRNDETKISALIIIINSEMLLGRSKAVIEHCNLAINLAREKHFPYKEVKLLSMLGSQYQTLMLTEKAKYHLDKAENMMDSIKLPDSLYYVKGNLYNVKGIMFRDDLNCEFALKYFDKALSVYKQKVGQISVTNQALINIQKGSCLLSEGELDKAKTCFEAVLKADFSLGNNRYYAQICLAEILIKQNQSAEASKILSKIPLKVIEQEDPELSSLYYLAMANLSRSEDAMVPFQMYMEKYSNSLNVLNKNRSKMISQLIYDSQTKRQEEATNIQTYHILTLVLLLISAFLILFTLYKKL